MKDMLYHCWAFNQDRNFSFMQPELWEPYLARFKIWFSQEPSETVEASEAVKGDGEETYLERADRPK